MQYTTNYNLGKPDGTDLVNPLSRTTFNTNFDTIDQKIKEASEQGGIQIGSTAPANGDLWVDTSVSSQGGTFNDMFTNQVNNLTLSGLNTTSKTVVGAINELLALLQR